MSFLKSVWTFLVGVKDALVLIFMLLFFGILWAGLSWRGPVVSVPAKSALVIDLDGTLVDQASENSPVAMLTGEPVIPQTETSQLVRAIDLAAEDSSIQMIALDLDGFMGGGMANLQSVGEALSRFRAKGKPVETWATGYSDSSYYLASYAGKIGVAPMGTVLIAGPGGTNLYFKDALDKLKVDVEVFRVGTYKSFVEPFTRTESSPEARAADQELVDDIWAQWRAGVEKQRKGLNMGELVASWPARVTGANRTQAQLALDAGLVDVVQPRDQWARSIREKVGAGKEPDRPSSFSHISLGDYWAARGPAQGSGPAVAVVHVAGTIVDGEAPQGVAGGETIAGLIEDAIADKDVKALVVRVDSGGGSTLASERIRLAMQEARDKKIPVIASFGPVAASGGYWVGTGADMIFANSSTITGSIGVFGIIPTFERSLKALGVTHDGIETTPFSGQPDIVGGLNDPTRAIIQGSVEDNYRQFLGLVSTARKMPMDKVEAVAEGRIWSGQRAKELGLIDAFGDLDAAIAEAGRRAGIKDKPRVKVMHPEKAFLVQLLSTFTSSQIPPQPDALAMRAMASRANALAQLQGALAIANGPTIQAHCMGCVVYSGPSVQPKKSPEMLAIVKAMLPD